tara:strand:- start:7162 stop:7596 length:435 start_codon:yes stop_codon:yes gene_type:complete
MNATKDRDVIIALLAIGAAMADPKIAAELDLAGVPKKNDTVRRLANAVRVLQGQSVPGSPEAFKAKQDLAQILAKLGITLKKDVKLKHQILDAANEWGVAARAVRWAKKTFEKFLIPKGSRSEVIAIFREQGFDDVDRVFKESE